MSIGLTRRSGLKGSLLVAAASPFASTVSSAQSLKGGTLRVAILADIQNFDPQQFSAINFPLIKNLYDSLIEYTSEGEAVPSLAASWTIGQGNTSVTAVLRKDVAFHSGAPLNADAVAASLKKGADPQKGKNVYATMSVVKDWTVVDAQTIRLNFTNPVPDRQITDLLQFLSVIDPAGIDTVETKPAGSGPFMLAERVLGQRIRLVANPKYWRPQEPIVGEILLTVFSDNDAASAALESGAVDIIYNVNSRTGIRLRNAGFQLVQGPGALVQTFRLNATRGPFRNEKYRQAFNYLIDRQAILRVGYVGLGQVTVLPWALVSPAVDKSYDTKYAFDLDKGRALLKESGLSDAEMSNWKMLVDGGIQENVAFSQLVQNTLTRVGIKIELDLKQGSEYIEALLGGKFDATFGGIGNIQKFPTRVATNSIYRTTKNPVLGDPHPFPAYVAAIARVDNAFGTDVKPAYDNLNKVLVEVAFAIPTNTYEYGLIVAAKNVGGITREIDNMLAARTIGFR